VQYRGMSLTLPEDEWRLLDHQLVVDSRHRVHLLRWSSGDIQCLSLPSSFPLCVRSENVLYRGGSSSSSSSSSSLSLLLCSPLLRSDGLVGLHHYMDLSGRLFVSADRLRSACWHGAAVTEEGRLEWQGRRRHPQGGWQAVFSEKGGFRAVGETGTYRHQLDHSWTPEATPGLPLPASLWLDPADWSLRYNGQTVWSDNAEPSWWPLSVDSICVTALLLTRPLRIVRHPIAVFDGFIRRIPTALLCRKYQLALHSNTALKTRISLPRKT
jgi:hypothetical protein